MENERRTRYERGAEQAPTGPPAERRRYASGVRDRSPEPRDRPPEPQDRPPGGPPPGGPPPAGRTPDYQSAGPQTPPPAGARQPGQHGGQQPGQHGGQQPRQHSGQQPGWHGGQQPGQQGAQQPVQQPPPGPGPAPPGSPGHQTRLVGEPGGQWERPPIRPVSVEDVVREDVVTVQPDTPVRTLVASMAENDVGTVVVVDDERPVGIVTDRMVAMTIEQTPDLESLDAGDVMTEELVTVPSGTSVDEVLGVLSDEGIRRVPVVDDRERLRGIVSLDDLVVLLASEFDRVRQVVEKQAPRF